MLRVTQLSKSFGIDILFQEITFSVLPGERVGLVGPNGCGKTTLLRIITGEERADSGSVQRTPADLRTGYLAQGLAFAAEDTLGQFIARMQGDLAALSRKLENLAARLVQTPDDSHLHAAYDETLAQVTLAAENSGQAPAVLAAFGLDNLHDDLPVAALSGGQKTRLALAGILISRPQLLLLDEPTNHLDLEMLEWLEDWLASYPGAALVVSHDRAFLDQVATSILDMDPLTRTARRYEGNYAGYLEEKLAERERHWQAYRDQQDEIARLSDAAAHTRGLSKFRKGGKADTGDKFAKGFFANRGLETMRRAKHIEARIERLLNEDRIDKPGRTWQMQMDFADIPDSGRLVLELNDLSVGYGENVLLAELNLAVRYGQRIALIGPNGAGKTTLLRTIAGQIPPLSGSVRLGANVRTGYMAQEQENLDLKQTPLALAQGWLKQSETEVRSFLSKYLFTGDEVFTQTGSLSYGERARLSLAGLAAQGCNFLLLDEPVNHLDIPSRARFEQALAGFPGTCMAVVHDRYFIEGYASEIWSLQNGRITVIGSG